MEKYSSGGYSVFAIRGKKQMWMKRRNNMSFGKNLQYLRQLSKDMTQEALAEKLGVSRQTISKWEVDAAIHIDRPFDNPFVTIPGAYHTLNDFMRTNGLEQAGNEVIPCFETDFETDGENMDVYIACK